MDTTSRDRRRARSGRHNTILMLLGIVMIVVDGYIMTLKDADPAFVRTMLIVSIVVCVAVIALVVWNIVRDQIRINRESREESSPTDSDR